MKMMSHVLLLALGATASWAGIGNAFHNQNAGWGLAFCAAAIAFAAVAATAEK